MEEEESVADLKIILLGDSAVGKSKLVERFLMDVRIFGLFYLFTFSVSYRRDAHVDRSSSRPPTLSTGTIHANTEHATGFCSTTTIDVRLDAFSLRYDDGRR